MQIPRFRVRRPRWISERAWHVVGVVVALAIFAAIFSFILWPLTTLWR